MTDQEALVEKEGLYEQLQAGLGGTGNDSRGVVFLVDVQRARGTCVASDTDSHQAADSQTNRQAGLDAGDDHDGDARGVPLGIQEPVLEVKTQAKADREAAREVDVDVDGQVEKHELPPKSDV